MRWSLALIIVALSGSLASAKSYTVKTGDTLYGISHANGVNLSRLLMLNPGLNGTDLQPGQKLELPDDAKPATVSATKPAPSASSVTRTLSNTSVTRAAYRYVGSPYVWGAAGPRAFDCSGFVMTVMAQFGVKLPHSSRLQAQMGSFVTRGNLQPGDLVFFATRGAGISHVAIYVGNNSIVHASTPSTGVIVSSLSERYYAARYVGARRVL
jgi:cell wall-associated NlpC family hydrolase